MRRGRSRTTVGLAKCHPHSIHSYHAAPTQPCNPAIPSLSIEDWHPLQCAPRTTICDRPVLERRPRCASSFTTRLSRSHQNNRTNFFTSPRAPRFTSAIINNISPSVMDFAYSPHREGGGTMHLPSPTHHHGYGLESLSSIQQLRRSLSRSPSKPSRFNLRKSDSPGSPISPLALARAFSPRPNKDQNHTANYPDSPLATQIPPPSTKKRFTLRRSAPFRSSPRNRPASKSPRRALAESTDHGNATPFAAKRPSGEENNVFRRTSAELLDKMATEQKPSTRFDVDDKPIKFDLARSRQDLNADVPAKSSPLKRSDGIMNLDTAGVGSPVAKRRSLHGASTFGADFDIFDHAPTPRSSGEEPRRGQDAEPAASFSFSSPISKTQSPLRKTSSLRKTTLSQRYGSNAPKPKPAFDGEFALPVQAASKSRQRMSLDGSLAFSSGTTQSPFRRSGNFDAMRGPVHQPFLRGGPVSHQPHPLSNALTPSSSSSSMTDDPPSHAPIPPTAAPPQNHPFARSLPIGASRPHHPPESSDGSFETPMAFKMARPNPDAFMSTGLLSKKNRNVDEPHDVSYIMPGTPSKRNSFPPVTASPSMNRRSNLLDMGKLSRPEFGQPSTPFSLHKPSSSMFYGKGVNIFGSFESNHQRRSSFASIDGDDHSNSNSPCGNHMTDSQSSADDMPPTPTKQGDGAGRRSKESSLRRKTFGRQRATLDTDTFAAPADQVTPSIDIPPPPSAQKSLFGASSPQTPNESFMPPDPSKLSISGQRRGSLPFNSSTNSNPFPPATPTTPRDHSNFFANGQGNVAPIAGLTQNDVDSSLARRFHSVALFGNGEFSMVYKVENPVDKRLGFTSPPASRVWAVKKSKKPYTGPSDREKKMTEVHILHALRGHDHIVSLQDHWDHNGHLYIQTEYCEEGNLKDFLAVAGNKSRLDDFRIWKILLELSLVSTLPSFSRPITNDQLGCQIYSRQRLHTSRSQAGEHSNHF